MFMGYHDKHWVELNLDEPNSPCGWFDYRTFDLEDACFAWNEL